ncbi:MAG: N-acetyl-gamma-glutamyl-phosphate reductase [Lachnospiraceae bacterium]|nr:N-acetyl-gamma-glutamyl-phosphate reductase [Lachnospiraceae bacterium]
MSKKFRVFIDGSAGTTGLRIAERLAQRSDIELLSIAEEDRKDVQKRADVINSADLAFLCLPDDAAREVVPLVHEDVKLLDTSTAHRTNPAWTYGFPELKGQRDKIKNACRVAVPGCHASGFIALAAPLVQGGLIPADYPFTCHSLTGYSGGGKKMIGQYEEEGRPDGYDSPRPYALSLHHKHLPEMQAVCGLTKPPVFCPIVADYYSGMETMIPLHMDGISSTPEQIHSFLKDYYAGQALIRVHDLNEVPADGTIASNTCGSTDHMEIFVTASPDGQQMMLISLFNNLGKGASGAAIQCMNILLGVNETEGLE